MTDLGGGSVPRAAERRLEAFAASLGRIGVEDFRQVALSDVLAPDREALRAEATGIARGAGLGVLHDDARRTAEQYVLRVYAAGSYRATWFALNWGLSLGPTRDRVAAIVAVQDAATAAVIEPFAAPELVEALRAPFETVALARPASRATPFAGGHGAESRSLATISSVGVVVIALAVALLVIGVALAPR
jgi:hypothetical protein